MARRVTDLEEFALRHVWRPYQSMAGYDHRRPLEALPMSLEETADKLVSDKSGWSECVLNRIVTIGFTFPSYVVHPLVDVVRAALAKAGASHV